MSQVWQRSSISFHSLTKSLLDKIYKSWYNKRVIRTADKVIKTEIGELYESECYELEKSKGYARN
jgi:hypothetical protein